jgi:streptogramin lyase
VTALTVSEDGAVYAATAPGAKVYRIESGRSSVYYAPKAEYVWALALSGPVLYVATGLPGEIHRVTASGTGERIHQTSDPHVRRLAVDYKGRVWAGTSGSGLLLRIDPSGRSPLFTILEIRDHRDRSWPRRTGLGGRRLRGGFRRQESRSRSLDPHPELLAPTRGCWTRRARRRRRSR